MHLCWYLDPLGTVQRLQLRVRDVALLPELITYTTPVSTVFKFFLILLMPIFEPDIGIHVYRST